MFELRGEYLFNPESPGVRVYVVRGFWGRVFKPKHFATLRECLFQYAYQQGRK